MNRSADGNQIAFCEIVNGPSLNTNIAIYYYTIFSGHNTFHSNIFPVPRLKIMTKNRNETIENIYVR